MSISDKLERFVDAGRRAAGAAQKTILVTVDAQIKQAGEQLLELHKMRATVSGEQPGAAYQSPEHLAAALTWIEQHEPDGIALVARALSSTGR
jgi:hypothetical protein